MSINNDEVMDTYSGIRVICKGKYNSEVLSALACMIAELMVSYASMGGDDYEDIIDKVAMTSKELVSDFMKHEKEQKNVS